MNRSTTPFTSNYQHPPPVFDKAAVPANQCLRFEIGVPGEGGRDAMQPAQQKLLPTLEHGALAFVAVALHLVAYNDELQLAPESPLPVAVVVKTVDAKSLMLKQFFGVNGFVCQMFAG